MVDLWQVWYHEVELMMEKRILRIYGVVRA